MFVDPFATPAQRTIRMGVHKVELPASLMPSYLATAQTIAKAPAHLRPGYWHQLYTTLPPRPTQGYTALTQDQVKETRVRVSDLRFALLAHSA